MKRSAEFRRSDASVAEVAELRERIIELETLINTPQTGDWISAVRLEAAHQIERWGVEQDAGKSPSDWFWLIGYLSGKALASAVIGNVDKAKHHTISTGAALLNWHRHLTGESRLMRPGIAEPACSVAPAQCSTPTTHDQQEK